MRGTIERICLPYPGTGTSSINLTQYEPEPFAPAAVQVSIDVHGGAASLSVCGWLPLCHLDQVIAFLERARSRRDARPAAAEEVVPPAETLTANEVL